MGTMAAVASSSRISKASSVQRRGDDAEVRGRAGLVLLVPSDCWCRSCAGAVADACVCWGLVIIASSRRLGRCVRLLGLQVSEVY